MATSHLSILIQTCEPFLVQQTQRFFGTIFESADFFFFSKSVIRLISVTGVVSKRGKPSPRRATTKTILAAKSSEGTFENGKPPTCGNYSTTFLLSVTSCLRQKLPNFVQKVAKSGRFGPLQQLS